MIKVVFILGEEKKESAWLTYSCSMVSIATVTEACVCVLLGSAVTLTVDLSVFRGSDYAIKGCGC